MRIDYLVEETPPSKAPKATFYVIKKWFFVVLPHIDTLMTTLCLLSSQTVVVNKKTIKNHSIHLKNWKNPDIFLGCHASHSLLFWFSRLLKMCRVTCIVPPLCQNGKNFFHQGINTQLPKYFSTKLNTMKSYKVTYAAVINNWRKIYMYTSGENFTTKLQKPIRHNDSNAL